MVQAASIRSLGRRGPRHQPTARHHQAKFDAVLPLLTPHMQVTRVRRRVLLCCQIKPPAPSGDDTRFAQELLAQYNVVLPGHYIALRLTATTPAPAVFA